MNQDTDKVMVAALLAELAAKAEVTRLKNKQGKHWERELFNEVCGLQNLAATIRRMVEPN